MRVAAFRLPDSAFLNATRPDARDIAPQHSPGTPPIFNRAVPDGGYEWWYIDALSDDGRHGLTIIAFVGSVFSPYYAAARRRGPAAATNHCALNVAVYGPGARWAMTERGAGWTHRSADTYHIGSSSLHWDGACLTIEIDEHTSPFPRRLRGIVRVRPRALPGMRFALDASGQHHWTPISPRADVSVDLRDPDLSWSGLGYFDSNSGSEPLEAAFQRWNWSRLSGPGETAILYDTTPLQGADRVLALRVDDDGNISHFDAPPPVTLPRGLWHVPRATRADRPARLLHTLEDAPFYLRSVIDTSMAGQCGPAMHESLDLDRFRRRWVQTLLPVRMPRTS